MPKSSHHRGVGKVPGEGEKGMVRWRRGSTKIVKTHHVAMGGGGGMHQVSGRVDLDVVVLGLPHRVGNQTPQ